MKKSDEKNSMYRLLFVLAMILAATFNTACSSSDDDDDSGGGRNLPQWAKAFDLDQYESYGGKLVYIAQDVPVDISSRTCYIGKNSYRIEKHTRWFCKVGKDTYLFCPNSTYFFYRNGHLHMLIQSDSELDDMHIGSLTDLMRGNYEDNVRAGESGGSEGDSSEGSSSIYKFYKVCPACKVTQVMNKVTEKEYTTMEVYKSTISGTYYLKTGRDKYISLTRRKYSASDEVGPEYNYFCIYVASVGTVDYWYYVKI